MLIIGIAGGTGSGKTTVVNQIINELPANTVGVISQDAYYNDLSNLSKEERSHVNFDHPDSIDFELLIKHLKELKEKKTIQKPVYSFEEETRLEKTILTAPKEVFIVEGILIFSDQKLRNLFDIKIFVQADADERLIRRLQRDTKERGHSLEKVLHRYKTTVKPMHKLFIEPSKAFADIIIPNNNYNTTAINIVKSIINEKLN